MRHRTRSLLLLAAGLIPVSCGPSGGGGGSGGGGATSGSTGTVGAVPATKADEQVKTFATTGRDGSWSQVDLIPVAAGTPAGPAVNAPQAALLATLQTLSGTDINANWTGISAGLPTAGFDTYLTGVAPGAFAGFILAANNLYDMFQTRTGNPRVALITTPPPGFIFTGFTGGDIGGTTNQAPDGIGDGGPGLFSNLPAAATAAPAVVPPKAPVLPNTMGNALAGGSGRGPQADDEHQFIQVVFPYPLDRASLFNDGQGALSFLGDSLQADNVVIQVNGIRRQPPDAVNVFNILNAHVPGVAVIGNGTVGVSAIPTGFGVGPTHAIIDANPLSATFSNVPTGCRAMIGMANVFTYVAHESPALIPVAGVPQNPDIGRIDPLTGTLILPNPTTAGQRGGRVFGATGVTGGVFSSVNDFGTSADQTAEIVGFVSVKITRVRSGGSTIANPYFHSFPVDQSNVGADDRAVVTPFGNTFNRGPAITIAALSLPSIEVLDPAVDGLGVYSLAPASDAVNTVSTRARFRVDFDREVVPNSVGFSRRHTIHTAGFQGTVFPFNGNTRPITSPAGNLTGGLASPLAPSIYLAVTQPAGINRSPAAPQFGFKQKTNSPFGKALQFDTGAAFTAAQKEQNGLNPQAHNTLAEIVRGIVPCDIYPLNQNNLQSYVVEPLVELPPNVVVTLGVCTAGLGFTKLGVSGKGNFTRSGTQFTTHQGINAVALSDDASQKPAIIANETIIKVNAGPMDLQGQLFFGGTDVAIDRKVNGVGGANTDDLTVGGFNVARSFRVGADNQKLYLNAPVSPQAMYLGFSTGGISILDLAGTGYNTNAPGGGIANTNFFHYTQVSRFLPRGTQSGAIGKFNFGTSNSVAAGTQLEAFGILGKYTAGSSVAGSIESEIGIGKAIGMGFKTPQPGINEGSSGYETLVSSGVTGNNPATAKTVFTTAGNVRDIEVGDFLDAVFFDKNNPHADSSRHRSYNTPNTGQTNNNLISDPPVPNPPPLRFPVGLPHTHIQFDQADLTKPPTIIDGNEVFAADGFVVFQDGTSVIPFGGSSPSNGFIQLNPTNNLSNLSASDKPHLPKAGFNIAFLFGGILSGANPSPQFVHTGPMPETSTAPAVVLTQLNTQALGSGFSGGLLAPVYQARQQIGNYLFATDGVNRKLLAFNSNTMDLLHSLPLPDPYGLGLSADLRKLFVSNEGDNTLSIVDSDPVSPFFMTEIKRTKVGAGPRAVSCNPDGEDVFVVNFTGNTVSILDQVTGSVRKTLTQNGLNRPWDVACGMREYPLAPSFASGTYHAFISNNGGQDTLSAPSVVVFESGPTGQGGLGYDNIIGGVSTGSSTSLGLQNSFKRILGAKGIAFDPNAIASDGALTIGAFVAHRSETGKAVVSRISYFKDLLPGQQPIGSNFNLGTFGGKVFEVIAQYVSTFNGDAVDVALPDYSRRRFELNDFGQFWNLFNAGGTTKSSPISVDRNSKFPLADVGTPFVTNHPRWEPDRVYFSVGHPSRVIEVFDLNGQHLNTITLPPNKDATVLATYFGQ